ncbi:unnamed protein product [Prunus brigantina]
MGRQGEGQQRDQLANMSQASASPTQSNVRERLGPRLDIHARLGPQGNVLQRLGPQGGQPDDHRNEDCEERLSAVHSQRSIHERLSPQGGQLGNPHNEDHKERRSAAHSRRVDPRRQATENLSQAQSTNTPPRQRRQEGHPSHTNEEVNQRRPNHEGRQHDQSSITTKRLVSSHYNILLNYFKNLNTSSHNDFSYSNQGYKWAVLLFFNFFYKIDSLKYSKLI